MERDGAKSNVLANGRRDANWYANNIPPDMLRAIAINAIIRFNMLGWTQHSTCFATRVRKA